RTGGDRSPQPALAARLLPARLVHVLDRRRAHRRRDLRIGGRQRLTHLFLQTGHAAQGDGHAEDHLGDILQAALTDVVTAAEVTQNRRQARAEGVRPDLGRDDLAGNVAAVGASAGVALELGDDGTDPGQFGELVPDRIWVVGTGLLGQARPAG